MTTELDGEIYRQHAGELCRLATVLVGPTDAGDVVADAVVAALSSPCWPSVIDHRAYLYRAVVNAARARARSDSRRSARERRSVQMQALNRGHVLTVPATDHDDVVRALMELSPRQRAIVYLTYWEDLRPSSSAALLGI